MFPPINFDIRTLCVTVYPPNVSIAEVGLGQYGDLLEKVRLAGKPEFVWPYGFVKVFTNKERLVRLPTFLTQWVVYKSKLHALPTTQFYRFFERTYESGRVVAVLGFDSADWTPYDDVCADAKPIVFPYHWIDFDTGFVSVCYERDESVRAKEGGNVIYPDTDFDARQICYLAYTGYELKREILSGQFGRQVDLLGTCRKTSIHCSDLLLRLYTASDEPELIRNFDKWRDLVSPPFKSWIYKFCGAAFEGGGIVVMLGFPGETPNPYEAVHNDQPIVFPYHWADLEQPVCSKSYVRDLDTFEPPHGEI